jgi:DNA-binding NtrC family response regulator
VGRTFALTKADRRFLRDVEQVIFGNPFSAEREPRLGRLIAGARSDDVPRDFATLTGVVRARMQSYEVDGIVDRRRFGSEDRPLVDAALLSQAYNRVVPDLDRLIERQAGGAGGLEPVSFGDRTLADLVVSGFSEAEASQFFALFFQVRRAYYFVDRLLVGNAPSMRQLRLQLWNSLFTHDARTYARWLWSRMEEFSTLLLGETGTGKGSAAAAIGRSGFIPYLADRRRFAADFTASFVSINLAQFPLTLIESELFGHRKGAFTGAIDHHQGLFERCSAHGALFLDEIGEVGASVQIKLLQVLQERVFTPIGSHDAKRFAGRVIAATNRPLEELRQTGRFRDDFFYRLCSQVVVVPPLRQRIAEDPTELQRLVALLTARMIGEPAPEVSRSVMVALRRDLPDGYPWPGNVRELEQAVRRILLTNSYRGDTVDASRSSEDQLVAAVRGGSLAVDELVGRYCAMLYRRHATFAEVAGRTGLDRRTVRKHILAWSRSGPRPVSASSDAPAVGGRPDPAHV